jgi:hypothetical protein
MRKFVAILVLLAVITILGCFIILNLYAKSKYDQARRSEFVGYAVTTMDSQSTAFLAKVQSDWKCYSDVTNGADNDVVKMAGLTPSVCNVISVYNYKMPPYNWFSPSENREAAKRNLIKSKFMPVSFDKEWHVSADEHLAFLICRSNAVYVYRDELNGLRATLYFMKRQHPIAPPVAASHQ